MSGSEGWKMEGVDLCLFESISRALFQRKRLDLCLGVNCGTAESLLSIDSSAKLFPDHPLVSKSTWEKV